MQAVAADEGEEDRQKSAALRTRAYGDHANKLADFQEQEACAEQGGHRHRAVVHCIAMGASAYAGDAAREARQQEEGGLERDDMEMEQLPAARAASRLVHQDGVGGEERREHHNVAEQEDPEPVADNDALLLKLRELVWD